MPAEDSWHSIEKELSGLINNGEYKLLFPLLEGICNMVNAKPHYPPEIIQVLLDVVKSFQMELSKGKHPYELAKNIASGLVQPEWNIQGNVYQANRDTINNFVIKFISNNLSELAKDKPKPILIPIVLLVMNASEAEKLASESVFEGSPDKVRADFQKLLEILAVENINWKQRYHDSSQAWQPFLDRTDSIEELLKNILNMIEGYPNPIEPAFLDIRKLNNDRLALKELRTEGCVVIMDVISMRYPDIQCAFRQSLLDAFPRTMVARIAPNFNVLNIEQQMISIIEHYVDLESHKRFKLDYDHLCDDEVYDITRFNRWLKEEIKKIVPDEIKSQKGIRKYWYKISGVG